MRSIGFIGAGNMATAIINGLTKNNNIKLLAFDIDSSKLDNLKTNGVAPCGNAGELVLKSDIIFLCVKPQDFANILEQIKLSFSVEKLIVSIAAGITMNYIEKSLLPGTKIVRVMPNTPLMMGCGASALCKNSNASNEDLDDICSIFSGLGEIAIIDESKINAVTSVNGSSPAYVYLFVKAMLSSAVEQGIDYDTALKLVVKTIEGSCLMLKNSGKTPDELISMVASKGGTTIKALETLREYKFEEAIGNAMKNCERRAEELSL